MKFYLQIIFFALLAITVNSFVYFGFTNSYSSHILNYNHFLEQFQSGIYQYRILSGSFLKMIYQFLGTLNLDYSVFKLKFLQQDSEPQMYLSLYILNTFFLVLTTVVIAFILRLKNIFATESEKLLILLVAIFSMVITQFVLVPYDCSSYFFLVLFCYFLMKYIEKKTNILMIILVIILIISTINRESSALSIALAASLLWDKFKLKKEFFIPIFILATSFIATYLGLRLMNENYTTNDGVLLKENFNLYKNLLGISFWILFLVFTLLVANNRQSRLNIVLFHLFSIPYIFMCFYTGILYEIRLYIPLFITSLLLSKYREKALK